MRSARVALGFVGAVCALAPGISSGQGAIDPRLEMDGFAAALDAAVRRVSRPSPALLAGREGARGYRLPGFGVLFVLSPRALPSPSQRSIAEHEAARSLDDAIRHLEQGLRTASPGVRAQMEKNLQALRQTRAELRGTARDRSATVFMLPPPDAVLAGEEMMAAGPPPLEDLQRELEAQMIEQMHALQEAEQSRGEQEREMARRMAEQVRELQARMEAVRRDVERARIEAERQVEMRLAVPPAATVTPVAPEAPAPPVAPLAPRAAVEPDTVAESAAAPPMPGPPMLAPAPWQMWFTIEDPADGRTGEAVMRDVKTAVTALLERQGAALHHLRPEEYVAVAVDFVPRPMMVGGRAPKTLLVKVRKRDLDERRAGRLAAEELRSRIEYAEY